MGIGFFFISVYFLIFIVRVV